MEHSLDVVTPYSLLREWSNFLELRAHDRGLVATPVAIAGRLLAENEGYLSEALNHARHILTQCKPYRKREIENFKQVCELLERAARQEVTVEYLADLYQRYISPKTAEDLVAYDPELVAAEAIENAGSIYTAGQWLAEFSDGISARSLEAAQAILYYLSSRASLLN